MKKLMIATVVAMVAIASQAVSLKWGFGGKVWVTEDGATAKLATDYTGKVADNAALCLIYVGQNKSSFELGADGTLGSGQSIAGSAAYAIAGGMSKGKWSPTTTSTDLSKYSDGASFGIVFFDGSKYSYVSAVDSSGNVGSAYQTAVAYADLSGQTALDDQYATGAAGNVAGAITNAGAAPVPEPTSGLMLVLGLAGLALRRRRA